MVIRNGGFQRFDNFKAIKRRKSGIRPETNKSESGQHRNIALFITKTSIKTIVPNTILQTSLGDTKLDIRNLINGIYGTEKGK